MPIKISAEDAFRGAGMGIERLAARQRRTPDEVRQSILDLFGEVLTKSSNTFSSDEREIISSSLKNGDVDSLLAKVTASTAAFNATPRRWDVAISRRVSELAGLLTSMDNRVQKIGATPEPVVLGRDAHARLAKLDRGEVVAENFRIGEVDSKKQVTAVEFYGLSEEGSSQEVSQLSLPILAAKSSPEIRNAKEKDLRVYLSRPIQNADLSTDLSTWGLTALRESWKEMEETVGVLPVSPDNIIALQMDPEKKLSLRGFLKFPSYCFRVIDCGQCWSGFREEEVTLFVIHSPWSC